jgi:hypothetical protein
MTPPPPPLPVPKGSNDKTLNKNYGYPSPKLKQSNPSVDVLASMMNLPPEVFSSKVLASKLRSPVDKRKLISASPSPSDEIALLGSSTVVPDVTYLPSRFSPSPTAQHGPGHLPAAHLS